MRVLLDECVPQKLAELISGHTVKTAPQVGWASVKNGELLKLAARDFDVMITVDKRMIAQQDATTLPLPVIVLRGRSTQLKHLKQLVPELLTFLRVPLERGFHILGA